LIDVRWDHRISDIRQDDDGVHVVCDTAGGRVEVDAAYAVACAGARSDEIRRMLGLTFDGHSFETASSSATSGRVAGLVARAALPLRPGLESGPAGADPPLPDSTFRIDWQVPGDYDLAAEQASGALERRIGRSSPRRRTNRVAVGVPVPLPGGGPDAGRPGAGGGRLRAPGLAVRRAGPQLRCGRRGDAAWNSPSC